MKTGNKCIDEILQSLQVTVYASYVLEQLACCIFTDTTHKTYTWFLGVAHN